MNSILKIQVVCLLLTFCSCASFIKEPKSLERWKYFDQKECPKIYNVISEQTTDYYYGKELFFTCNYSSGSTLTSKCIKHSNHFLNLSQKQLDVENQKLIKKSSKGFPCFETSSIKHPEISIKIKSKVVANMNAPWAFLTGFTLGIIPFRGTQKHTKTMAVVSLKTQKSKTLQIDSEYSFWMQIFLLPLMPFIGDEPVIDKIFAHENALLYEAMNDLQN